MPTFTFLARIQSVIWQPRLGKDLRGEKAIPSRGSELTVRIDALALRQVGIAGGLALIAFGLIGVCVGASFFSPWQEDRDDLHLHEHYGIDTREDHKLVMTEAQIVVLGLFLGGSMLILGVFLTVLAMGYRSESNNGG